MVFQVQSLECFPLVHMLSGYCSQKMFLIGYIPAVFFSVSMMRCKILISTS
jgi:hypothetical protein